MEVIQHIEKIRNIRTYSVKKKNTKKTWKWPNAEMLCFGDVPLEEIEYSQSSQENSSSLGRDLSC